MASAKRNIRSLSDEELSNYLVSSGFPKFRIQQIGRWIWNNNACDFSVMHNLGDALICLLNEHFFIDKLQIKNTQISSDKTIKCGFSTHEGQIIEGVLIPTATRMTACISSQVGCSLACLFCATGKMKLEKNLSPGEIVDQVVMLEQLAQKHYEKGLSNIVLMGMGEPLLNYSNVLTAIAILTDPNRYGISPKRITLSTAGIAKMIRKLGDDKVRFNLALSLHAADDTKRSEVMEINQTNNLDALSDALVYFHEQTKTRITFEYILFQDFNDSLEDAAKLSTFAKCVPCKINLIEYNPIGDGKFHRSNAKKTEDFRNYLEQKNLVVNVRRSRGKDIDAACGQLANKVP
ncbi:MAG: 23S rRNA (adenine(2503)-C(2))-methyltransferase RlmN [Bacteroidetes bacterium]|nr:23S rRNA (adenine(2503)-C(2))-methyltransferase RlmN [Bacteroidota bacterium]MBM3424891.1 23S rRNA (adenine(2503)-C(2))-methyltransferase RlmN [Bacteroidota bacterium]